MQITPYQDSSDSSSSKDEDDMDILFLPLCYVFELKQGNLNVCIAYSFIACNKIVFYNFLLDVCGSLDFGQACPRA